MPPKPRARTYAVALGSESASGAGSDVATDDDEYRQKRDRNNIAVKKSREKSRQRARETAEKMDRLRRENEDLERRTVELDAELKTLKNVLLCRAARRGSSAKDNKPLATSSVSSTSQDSDVILADPHTVCIDHEYTSANS